MKIQRITFLADILERELSETHQLMIINEHNSAKDEPLIYINDEDGLDELMEELCKMVEELDEVVLYENEGAKESHILFKFNPEAPFTITRKGNVWELHGKEIENLFYMTRFNEDESIERFGRKLRGMGVDEELEKMGAKRGDEIKILDYIFIFKD